jgi:hypothetical protein
LETYSIKLPNGDSVDRALSKEEVEFWVSLGMYLTHGFHAITAAYAVDNMDDEANVPVSEDGEVSIN